MLSKNEAAIIDSVWKAYVADRAASFSGWFDNKRQVAISQILQAAKESDHEQR